MRTELLKSSSGFTFIAALFIVVVMGIMLGSAAQRWQTIMQRDREEELLFRGSQIRDAIIRWRKPPPGQTASTPLNDLKFLLEDPRSAQKARHLRRLYTDPITGKDFNVVRDPTWGIIGVTSPSTDVPLKQANFPDELKDFGGKQKYSEWLFVYKTGATTGSTVTVGTPPGTPPPPVPTPLVPAPGN